MADPYKIEGPALISFSGGRTSGFMLWKILEAHGGKLPDDVVVSFQNTGKEMPETLDFIQECSDRWSVPIVWLEYDLLEDGKNWFKIVNHNSASRNGEPFKRLMDKKQYLPNPVTRFCTYELKVKTAERYCRQNLKWDSWDVIIGLRADEMRRVLNMRKRNGKDKWESLQPLADAGVDKQQVKDFWDNNDFDLNLENVNGTTPMGNCDLCFLKGAKTIMGIVRDRPELAKWWADAEAEVRSSKPSGANFRSDRPSYGRMLELVNAQGDMFDDLPDDATIPCTCTD